MENNFFSKIMYKERSNLKNKPVNELIENAFENLPEIMLKEKKYYKFTKEIYSEMINKKKYYNELKLFKNLNPDKKPVLLVNQKEILKNIKSIDDPIKKQEDNEIFAKSTTQFVDNFSKRNRVNTKYKKVFNSKSTNNLYKLKCKEIIPNGVTLLDPLIYKDELLISREHEDYQYDKSIRHIKQKRRKQYENRNLSKIRDTTYYIINDLNIKINKSLDNYYGNNSKKMDKKELEKFSKNYNIKFDELDILHKKYIKNLNNKNLKKKQEFLENNYYKQLNEDNLSKYYINKKSCNLTINNSNNKAKKKKKAFKTTIISSKKSAPNLKLTKKNFFPKNQSKKVNKSIEKVFNRKIERNDIFLKNKNKIISNENLSEDSNDDKDNNLKINYESVFSLSKKKNILKKESFSNNELNSDEKQNDFNTNNIINIENTSNDNSKNNIVKNFSPDNNIFENEKIKNLSNKDSFNLKINENNDYNKEDDEDSLNENSKMINKILNFNDIPKIEKSVKKSKKFKETKNNDSEIKFIEEKNKKNDFLEILKSNKEKFKNMRPKSYISINEEEDKTSTKKKNTKEFSLDSLNEIIFEEKNLNSKKDINLKNELESENFVETEKKLDNLSNKKVNKISNIKNKSNYSSILKNSLNDSIYNKILKNNESNKTLNLNNDSIYVENLKNITSSNRKLNKKINMKKRKNNNKKPNIINKIDDNRNIVFNKTKQNDSNWLNKELLKEFEIFCKETLPDDKYYNDIIMKTTILYFLSKRK